METGSDVLRKKSFEVERVSSTSPEVPAKKPTATEVTMVIKKETRDVFENTEDVAFSDVSMVTKKEDKSREETTKETPPAAAIERKESKEQELPLDDGKEVEDYVLVDLGDAEVTPETGIKEVHHDSISENDTVVDKIELEEIEDAYEADFFESDGENDVHEPTRDYVIEEEQPGDERHDEAKAVSLETSDGPDNTPKPVVEISVEFLELLEGFCMAASQEFPNDVIGFACRYFTRISKRRNALRKYSIEVSDQALFSDMDWCGNI